VNQVGITASPKLRVIFVVGAAVMLVLWGLSLIPPIENWDNPNEDGFSYVPAAYATITCLPVGLYLLAGPAALPIRAASARCCRGSRRCVPCSPFGPLAVHVGIMLGVCSGRITLNLQTSPVVSKAVSTVPSNCSKDRDSSRVPNPR
jgi:hypothetical protein